MRHHRVLNVMLNLKTLLDTEDQCLSILGGVLPKIWACSQEGSLQGQKRRFPLSRKSKVWSDSYHTSKQVDCYLWVSQVLSEQRPRQLQLQWKQIDGDFQLKQLSGGWGCGVHHCLLRSRSSCKHSSRYLWSFRTVPSVLKLSGKKKQSGQCRGIPGNDKTVQAVFELESQYEQLQVSGRSGANGLSATPPARVARRPDSAIAPMLPQLLPVTATPLRRLHARPSPPIIPFATIQPIQVGWPEQLLKVYMTSSKSYIQWQYV